ncbi:GntR family transcriptional regulator [Alkalihalobacillus pseudalcaliphilus]|uniref:GntR family transcriptional regulator n=1 Tax=Alkalihalobacillus pseudalcaliphilus TaxID=79884 RepID=UPI00064DC3F2|nr:GntR family transcriptional regulator [Alkalihalobacillus pseudalcaliphilus]KMK76126.1 transcriptional regulator [Alkalihalobacillus pseudalcaliphilus]
MTDTFQTNQPIYLQLVERIKKEIMRDELKPGDKLPSVRELAVQSGVNPNTVQRTYRELEHEKIAESRRGQGTFVTEDSTILTKMRESTKQIEIERFVIGMKEMGYREPEIIEGLQTFLQLSKRGDFE